MELFVLLIESLFFTIPLVKIKEINDKKQIIFLYIGMIVSFLASSFLDKSIFKYFVLAFLMLCNLFLVSRNVKFYDFFIIIIEMALKSIIEYICVLIFFNLVNYNIFVVIMEIISILVVLIPSKYYLRWYTKIVEKLKSRHKFYFRYILLILLNTIVIFIIYNLILIKGGA